MLSKEIPKDELSVLFFILRFYFLENIPLKTKDLLESLELSTFTAFDFETTGLDPNNDRREIIELAAIRFEHGEIVDRFVTLINPEIEIPPSLQILQEYPMRW